MYASEARRSRAALLLGACSGWDPYAQPRTAGLDHYEGRDQ
jgi:hypothetical protein